MQPIIPNEHSLEPQTIIDSMSKLEDGSIADLVLHEHDCVRIAAIAVLANRQSKPHLDTLIAALADPESRVRAQAALALGVLNDPRPTVIGSLRSALRDESPAVRGIAGMSLNVLGGYATFIK